MGYRSRISLGKEGPRTLIIVTPYNSLRMYAIVWCSSSSPVQCFSHSVHAFLHNLCESSAVLTAVRGTAVGGKGKMRSNGCFVNEALHGYVGDSVATNRLCGLDYEPYQTSDALC